MKAAGLESDIREIIAEILERGPSEITSDAKFVEDLGMDSMMALEILAAIEKRYRIKIPEQELPQITTLSKAVDLAKKYVK